MKSYQKLEVWKKSKDLVVEVYKLSQAFPTEERYGITSQIRRVSISIPSNIAVGWGCGSKKEYITTG